ncbi:MAG: hypothetical protein IJ689_03240 [Alphaproteobacteria bacterium]|nr:hypothetical protein [Alphaproteobacteria bacterium]
MNRYFLVVGIFALSLVCGGIRAEVHNSDTMTVSATINHDANIHDPEPIHFVLTINPSINGGSYNTKTGATDGGVISESSSATRGGFKASVPSGYDVNKFSFSPAEVTSAKDSNVKVGGFSATKDSVTDNVTHFYIDATLSYTGTRPKRGFGDNKHTFDPVTVTYNP